MYPTSECKLLTSRFGFILPNAFFSTAVSTTRPNQKSTPTMQALNILSKDKLAEIARKILGVQDVEITELQLKPLDGQNFAGDIVFCDFKAKLDNLDDEMDFHWAVKLPPLDSRARMPMHRMSRMEAKEIFFYEKVLPEWKALVKDRGASGLFKIPCCDSFYSEFHDDPLQGSLIVMDNLTRQGFHHPDDKRRTGLDLQHSKLALEALAKIHALGHAHLNSHGGGLEKALKENDLLVTCRTFVEPEEQLRKTLKAGSRAKAANFQALLGAVQGERDFVGALGKLIAKGDLFEFRRTLYRPQPGGFNTVCHGDAHINNVLFR